MHSDDNIAANKFSEVLLSQELNKVAKSGSYDGILRIVAYGLSFLINVILVRFAGAAAIGSVAVTLSAMAILQILPGMGLGMGILKNASSYLGENNPRNVGKVFLFSYAMTFFVAASLTLFYFLVLHNIASEFLIRSVGSLKIFDALILTLPLFCVIPLLSSSFQTLHQSYKSTLFDQIVRNISELLITFLFSLFLTRTFSLVYGNIVGIILSFAFQLIVIIIELQRINSFKKVPNDHTNDVNPISLLKFSLPLIAIPLLNNMTHELDIWIVGYYLTPTDAGIYSVVRMLGGLLLVPNLMFGDLFGVSIAKSISNNNQTAVSTLLKSSAKWIEVLTGFIFVIILGLSRDLLVIFGNDFKTGNTSLLIYACGMYAIGFFGATGPLLLMYNKKSLLNMNAVLMVILNIILGLWLTPILGINGAALSTGFTYLVGSFLVLGEVIYILKISPGLLMDFIKRILLVIACSLIVTLMSYLLADINYFIRLLICSIAAMCIYGLLILKIENWSDFEIGLFLNAKAKLTSFVQVKK